MTHRLPVKARSPALRNTCLPNRLGANRSTRQATSSALEVFLYALCTGRPPFRAETSYGVMRRIIDESSVPIREINPEIPDWLAQIVEKLMAKDKAGRFDSAKEVHTLLESCPQPRPATHTCRASRLAARRAGNDSAPGWAKDNF